MHTPSGEGASANGGGAASASESTSCIATWSAGDSDWGMVAAIVAGAETVTIPQKRIAEAERITITERIAITDADGWTVAIAGSVAKIERWTITVTVGGAVTQEAGTVPHRGVGDAALLSWGNVAEGLSLL